MTLITGFIAAAGFVLGCVNFYFNFIRKKRTLFLAIIRRISPSPLSEFALINGSDEDLLVTALEFQFREDGRRFTPSQTMEWAEGESLLLAPGKGIHGKPRLTEPLTTGFVKMGVQTDADYAHKLYLVIEWVQGDGKVNRRAIHLNTIVFRESGDWKTSAAQKFNSNLYRHSPVSATEPI